MKKFIFVLLVLPMLLLANGADTVYITRLDINTNFTDGVAGFDYQIWGTWHYDTTYDTNYYQEIDTILHFVEDSIVWNGAQKVYLYILPEVEVGRFNLFAIEMFGDVDSLQVDYILAATYVDFSRKPWDWRLQTALTTPADSIYDASTLSCEPFSKFIRWRLTDLAGKARVLFFRFKLKESG